MTWTPDGIHAWLATLTSLVFTVLCFFVAVGLIAVWMAGRLLTPKGDRSVLGIWYGRFNLFLALVLMTVVALTILRHFDLGEPTHHYWAIGLRLFGIAACVGSFVTGWFAFPKVMILIYRRLGFGGD